MIRAALAIAAAFAAGFVAGGIVQANWYDPAWDEE
jgi:hypothetical protein